jgi:membrane protease YdiL (CAAX protease family)
MTRFYRAAWFFYLFLSVAGLVGLAALGRTIDLRLFVDVSSWWLDLALGLGVGFALLGFWALVRWRLASARELERTLGRLVGPLGGEEIVALALISALGEEVAFRGALQSWLGLYPATALFALLHVGPGATFRPWTLFAFTGGLAFGTLVATRESLGAAIVAHCVVNLVQLRRISMLGAAEQPVEGAETSSEPPG